MPKKPLQTRSSTKSRRRLRIWPSIKGTPEQRASHAHSRLEDITRLVGEWVWEMDENTHITFISDQVMNDIGILPIQIIGNRFEELGRFIEPSQQNPSPDWQKPFRDKSFEILNSQSEVKRLLISSIPSFNNETGKYQGACGTARDISEIRATQQARNVLEEANLALNQASQAKSNFLANMSHELRTPLNAIMGFSDIMREQLFGPLGNDTYEGYATDIYQSGDHLLSLVNDILDLSKVEAGKLELTDELIHVAEIIQHCEEMMQCTARNAGIELLTDISSHPEITKGRVRLNGDVRSVRQMILNLMTNSIKFSPVGGAVKTIASLSNSNELIIGVQDVGIGIAQNEIDNILEPFTQLNSYTTGVKIGVGLGLAITKTLAEIHEGKVEIESELGVGTTISIRFPAHRTITINEPNP